MLRYDKRMERIEKHGDGSLSKKLLRRKSFSDEPIKATQEKDHITKNRRMRHAIEFSFIVPVTRIKPDGSRIADRFLCGNNVVIAETDEKHKILNAHDVAQLHALVRFCDSEELFAIEYKTGKTYQYESTTRDGVLLDLMQISERCTLGVPINFSKTKEGVKEGACMMPINPEYASSILARFPKLDKETFVDSIRYRLLSFES